LKLLLACIFYLVDNTYVGRKKFAHNCRFDFFWGGGKLGGSEKNRLITAGAKNDNPLSDFTLSLLKVVFF